LRLVNPLNINQLQSIEQPWALTIDAYERRTLMNLETFFPVSVWFACFPPDEACRGHIACLDLAVFLFRNGRGRACQQQCSEHGRGNQLAAGDVSGDEGPHRI